jgi:biopolymer transport protein ExbD
VASRGFLIRFIDIGLIVLFGFLMISDIEMSSRVDLAGAGQLPTEEPEPVDDRAFLVVEIGADGQYRVTDSYAPDVETIVETSEALSGTLRRGRDAHRAEGLQTVVLIQPDPDSFVQFTVDVMDVCDRLGLAKSLRMDIEVEAAPPPVADSIMAGDSVSMRDSVGGGSPPADPFVDASGAP